MKSLSWKESNYLEVTRDEVRDYLSEVKNSVNDGRYQISPRTKIRVYI